MNDKAPTPKYCLFDFPAWRSSQSVLAMTWAQRGVYFELLAIAWGSSTCSIPRDPRRLAAMLRMSVEEWERDFAEVVLEPWIESTDDPTRLIQPRLLTTWKEAVATSERLREQGKAGAKARGFNTNNQLKPSSSGAQAKPKRGLSNNITLSNITEEKKRESAPRTPARTREAPPARPPVVVDFDVFEKVHDLVEPLEANLPDKRPAKNPGSTLRRAAVAQLVDDFGRDRVAKVLAALPDLSVRSKEANGVFQKIRAYEDSLDGKVGADRFEQIERLLDEDRASSPPEKPKKGVRRFDSWGRLIPENGVYTEEETAFEIDRINREFEENERRKNEADRDEADDL